MRKSGRAASNIVFGVMVPNWRRKGEMMDPLSRGKVRSRKPLPNNVWERFSVWLSDESDVTFGDSWWIMKRLREGVIIKSMWHWKFPPKRICHLKWLVSSCPSQIISEVWLKQPNSSLSIGAFETRADKSCNSRSIQTQLITHTVPTHNIPKRELNPYTGDFIGITEAPKLSNIRFWSEIAISKIKCTTNFHI